VLTLDIGVLSENARVGCDRRDFESRSMDRPKQCKKIIQNK
jgi:hypothetical protein